MILKFISKKFKSVRLVRKSGQGGMGTGPSSPGRCTRRCRLVLSPVTQCPAVWASSTARPWVPTTPSAEEALSSAGSPGASGAGRPARKDHGGSPQNECVDGGGPFFRTERKQNHLHFSTCVDLPLDQNKDVVPLSGDSLSEEVEVE